MKLIILAGMPGAGKEEFLKAVGESGWPYLRMGDLVREEYLKRGLDEDTISVGQFAQQERDEHGMGIWADRASKRFQGRNHIVDGCRGLAEIDSFRRHSESMTVVAVHSSPAVRYARLIERARSDSPSDWKEFQERDRREMKWGLAELIALADEMVVNDTDLSTFHSRARDLMEGLTRT
ncbi:MAG: dephospho-CoA kinase [Spirochaetia bacterium]|nr:dephospho-CoA kinase [Spirochaetia bacterium]